MPEREARLGLDRHVERIFNSAQTCYEKSHPEEFRGMLDTLGRADVVWMIGDNADADVAGAKAAGIPPSSCANVGKVSTPTARTWAVSRRSSTGKLYADQNRVFRRPFLD
jgi:FMN phosphatase YigB (HAD superfamily)